MKNGSHAGTGWLLAAVALAGLPAAKAMAGDEIWSPGASATSYVRVTPQGDLATSKSPIPGPLHSNIGVGVSTSDYFRGAFDGVGDDLDEVNGIVDLSTTFQPINRSGGSGLTAMSITGGTSNGLTNGPAADQGDWHQSDNFVGVATQFGGGLTTGLTYTYYARPDISGTDPLQEVAGAVGYTGDSLIGRVSPQLKVAKPVDETDGWFTRASIRPAIPVGDMNDGAVEVSFPMEVGVGLDDYYGGTRGDTGVYGSVGAHVAVPLGLPQSYGSWAATAGVDTIIRDNTIKSAGGPLDDGGDVVVTGTVGMAVTF